MVYFRRLERGCGVEFAALSDRAASCGGILSAIKDGWRAEHLKDEKIIREILNADIDELMPEHALALECVDLRAVIGQIAESYEEDAGGVGEWLHNEILRKIYFALLEWGDGGTLPGQVARYFNAVGDSVEINYKEDWTR